MTYWPLLGIAVVVVGFVLRFNPVIVVVGAGLVSGLAAGKSIPDLLALLGESFVSNRALLMFALTLPTIGLLERAGLREHALVVALHEEPARVAEHLGLEQQHTGQVGLARLHQSTLDFRISSR